MAKQDDRMIISIYLTKQMCSEIDKKADRENISRNEQIRRYLEKGLAVEGYSQDVDFIATIIRQEFMAIYHVEDIQKYVELAVEKQTSRMEKMLTKVGKISAGGFFLLVKTLLQHTNEDAEDDFALLVEQAGKMGIEFMQQKNSTVNDILSDGKYVCRTAENNL